MEANKTPAKILKAFKAVMPIVRQFARKNQLAEVIQEDGGLIPVTKVLADAEAAIAALEKKDPPRNCDAYDSADEMMKDYADEGFFREWQEWRETGKCHELMLDTFLCIDWLFMKSKSTYKCGDEKHIIQ